MRYVTARPSKRKPERWYWQRPGFPLKRLPDDPAERWAMAERLNRQADGAEKSAPGNGTVAWCLERYQKSERFRGLAQSTRMVYERWCREFIAMWGSLPVTAIDRALVVDICDGMSGRPAVRSQAVAVLSGMFDVAIYHGVKVENVCHRLRLARRRPRRAYWLPADEKAFLAHADARLRLTFCLLLYTAQRPGDVLAMTWQQAKGHKIRVRQEKTGTLVEVPCHATLRNALVEAPRTGVQIVGWPHQGKARYQRFNHAFRRTLKAAGLTHLQARDLRRTAVVRMFEAGATVAQVAGVTGHTIDETQRIIDTYYARTPEMAAKAIELWERAEAGTGSNAAGTDANKRGENAL